MKHAMHKPVRALCLIFATALWLASTTVLAQTAMPMAAAASTPKSGMQSSMMASPDMKQAMRAGMDGMQKMATTGDTDKDFAMMMKMHHEQALDMARMELAHGKSPEMKSMASKIISAQKKEIAQLDRWLARQK